MAVVGGGMDSAIWKEMFELQKNSHKEMCTNFQKGKPDHTDPLLKPKFLIDLTIKVKDNGHEVIDLELQNKIRSINGDPEKDCASRDMGY